jgi:hypothetical protein
MNRFSSWVRVLVVFWAAAFLAPAHSATIVTLVEYRHSLFDHYFVTPVPAEIALLDAHQPPFQNWARTGFSFNAYASAEAPVGSVANCRFFNDHFAPKSSHFYAPHGFGCEATLSQFPDWNLEDSALFNSMLPDAAGICPVGSIPLYRLYNQGMGNAPNHRFVTSVTERQTMINQGWAPEGAGIGIGNCVPPTESASGLWRGTTDKGQAVTIFILDDGRYYILYTAAGTQTEDGVIHGTAQTADGKFTSTDLADFAVRPTSSGFIGGDLPIRGTFVPRNSLQLSNGQSSVAALYDNAFDTQVSLASLAGTWTVSVGHITQSANTTALMDSQGHMTVPFIGCDLAISLTPRGTTNVFNMVVVATRGECHRAAGEFFYDAANQKIIGLAKFLEGNGVDMFHLIGTR